MKKFKMLMGLMMMFLCVMGINKGAYADETQVKFKLVPVGFDKYDADKPETDIMFDLTYKNETTGKERLLTKSMKNYCYGEGNPYFLGNLDEGKWILDKVKIYEFSTYTLITDYCTWDIPEEVEVKSGDSNDIECTITRHSEIQTKAEDNKTDDEMVEEDVPKYNFDDADYISNGIYKEKDTGLTFKVTYTTTYDENGFEVRKIERKYVDVDLLSGDDDEKTDNDDNISEKADSKKKVSSENTKESSNIILYAGLGIGIFLIVLGIVLIALKLRKKN